MIKRAKSASILLLFFLGGLATAQDAHAPVRIEAEWILRYEQCWGVAGLYVDEPELSERSTDAARARADLVRLTLTAREFLRTHPDEDPAIARLLAEGLLDAPPSPPEGSEYLWSPRARSYVCTRGGAFDIVAGAIEQLRAAENYRRRVVNGAPGLYRAWDDLLALPGVPEVIRREIETRRHAVQVRESGPMKAARRTQELLGRLNDAINLATTLGTFQPGQAITMDDVRTTGLIELLEPLPLEGTYEVTRAGKPPAAVIGGVRVPYDPAYAVRRLEGEARRSLAEKPDYPPALALLAQAQSGEEALATINRAIAIWPDVPALRIQRIAILARLQRAEGISADIEFLLRSFPAAPVCLEIDLATRKEGLAEPGIFRATVASAMAEVRPEVLNLQVLAYKELLESGDSAGAAAIRKRIIDRHPGYEPLLSAESAKNEG